MYFKITPKKVDSHL